MNAHVCSSVASLLLKQSGQRLRIPTLFQILSRLLHVLLCDYKMQTQASYVAFDLIK
jgi:hypothetical protein